MWNLDSGNQHWLWIPRCISIRHRVRSGDSGGLWGPPHCMRFSFLPCPLSSSGKNCAWGTAGPGFPFSPGSWYNWEAVRSLAVWAPRSYLSRSFEMKRAGYSCVVSRSCTLHKPSFDHWASSEAALKDSARCWWCLYLVPKHASCHLLCCIRGIPWLLGRIKQGEWKYRPSGSLLSFSLA